MKIDFPDNERLLELIRTHTVREVAKVLGVEHPLLRSYIRSQPGVHEAAQKLMQAKYKNNTSHRLTLAKYRKILRRDNCVYCGIHPEDTKEGRMTIDHIVPRSADGENDIVNIAGACSNCNGRKASKSLLTFLLETKEED